MALTLEQLVARMEIMEAKIVKLTIDTPQMDQNEDKPNNVKEEKKPKKEKKVKDESKPKRKPSAYNMFCKVKRPEAKEQVIKDMDLGDDDKIPTNEVMRMVAKMWSQLSDEEKAEFKPTDESGSDEA